MRYIRFKELSKIVPLGRTTIWRMIQEGRFPQSVKLSKHASAWLESDILQWMEERQKGNAVMKLCA